MRNPHGTGMITDGSTGKVRSFDTAQCCHCNAIFRVKPLKDPADAGGFCRLCMELICSGCADKGACTPFEKQLDEIEKRDRFMRSAGLL